MLRISKDMLKELYSKYFSEGSCLFGCRYQKLTH